MTKSPRSNSKKSTQRRISRRTQHVLPLHHRIYMVLRRRLVEGIYVLDQPMPGEHRLAQDFKASRVTIRRVLERLREDKLIDRRHGSGTFPMAAVQEGTPAGSMSYYDYIAASSHVYAASLEEFSHLPTPGFLITLDARFGAAARKIVRVARVKSIPYHILCAYVPKDIAMAISRRNIGNKTVLELLKLQDIVATASELSIGAIAADTFEARLLKVAVGAPLVQAIRVSRLADGRVIEYNQILSVADRFGYRFRFGGAGGSMILGPQQ